MPKFKNAVPKYRKHKASGQAVVTLDGADHYLGKYGTKSSHMLYDRLVGEWLACGRRMPVSDESSLTVTELISHYWKHAKTFYRRADGTSTETAENMRATLRTLRNLYGDVLVDGFGPIALKAVRQKFVDSGQTRGYVNSNIDKIRRMFRWGVSEELVNESTLRRLESVVGLREGKTSAPDNPPVEPVEHHVVSRTLPELPPTLADMIQIQRFTGARPGEICAMKPCNIDRSSDVWRYCPERHKTSHHGKQRAIVIGPQAKAILRPYLDRKPDEYCFKPAEVVDVYLAEKHAKRVVPMSCGTIPGKRNSHRTNRPGECYTNDSYRRAVHRACDRAFPPPAPLAKLPGESERKRKLRLTEAQRLELAKWQSDHGWSPNQLRHSMGTEIRKQFGIEAVAAVLGHSKTDTSEIYARRNLNLAEEVARKLG